MFSRASPPRPTTTPQVCRRPRQRRETPKRGDPRLRRRRRLRWRGRLFRSLRGARARRRANGDGARTRGKECYRSRCRRSRRIRGRRRRRRRGGEVRAVAPGVSGGRAARDVPTAARDSGEVSCDCRATIERFRVMTCYLCTRPSRAHPRVC